MATAVQEVLFVTEPASYPTVVRIADLSRWANPFLGLHDAFLDLKDEVSAPVVIVNNDSTGFVALVSHLATIFGWTVSEDEALRVSSVYNHLLFWSEGSVQRAVQPTLF